MPCFEIQIKVTKTWVLTYDVEADDRNQAKYIVSNLEENGNLYWHDSTMYADCSNLPSNVAVSETQMYPNDVDVQEEWFDFEHVIEKYEEEEAM